MANTNTTLSQTGWRQFKLLMVAAAAASAAGGAGALELDLGESDVKARFDNTVRYTGAVRVKDRNQALLSPAANGQNINQDDSDRNFGKGVVSNRFDLLSELDVDYRGFGVRVSTAAWYDTVYNRSNDNTSSTANHAPAGQFAPATRDVMGRKAELLDAFIYGKFDVAEKQVNVRLGRHTLLWGESLFFGSNGIAGGMAPIDIVKATSVPNSQFKEIGRPTGKLSGQVQLSPEVTVGAYVGYEWEKSRLPASGSYLNSIDPGGPGGERLFAGPANNQVLRANDLDAKNSGQRGAQVRLRADAIDTDFGVYAIRYHALTPSNLTFDRVPVLPGAQYRFLHHEGIKAYGLSAAKSVGEWSLAGEVSYRRNAPLASRSTFVAGIPGFVLNNSSNPGYAVGETAHAQFSWLASLGPSFVAKEASFVGEVAWNKRMKVTQRADLLNPNADKSAVGLRMSYTPTYRQVMPGLDLSPSVGLGYTAGKSSAVGAGFGVDKGGDINIGLGGVYLGKWNMNLNYVHYLGPVGGTNDAAGLAQYKQSLKDRNFVTLSLRTTF